MARLVFVFMERAINYVAKWYMERFAPGALTDAEQYSGLSVDDNRFKPLDLSGIRRIVVIGEADLPEEAFDSFIPLFEMIQEAIGKAGAPEPSAAEAALEADDGSEV